MEDSGSKMIIIFQSSTYYLLNLENLSNPKMKEFCFFKPETYIIFDCPLGNFDELRDPAADSMFHFFVLFQTFR